MCAVQKLWPQRHTACRQAVTGSLTSHSAQRRTARWPKLLTSVPLPAASRAAACGRVFSLAAVAVSLAVVTSSLAALACASSACLARLSPRRAWERVDFVGILIDFSSPPSPIIALAFAATAAVSCDTAANTTSGSAARALAAAAIATLMVRMGPRRTGGAATDAPLITPRPLSAVTASTAAWLTTSSSGVTAFATAALSTLALTASFT
mmetsp:Transcript_65874/g.130594  ORF Transcript_65874/g.130594 Transcript_65874/m.130594 type:complete len:209 (-) Transcript_65874:1433-2059(-)